MTRLIPLSEVAQNQNKDLTQFEESPVGQTAHAEGGTEVGRVVEALAEPGGRIRYLLVDVGGWFSSKTVAVPVGLARLENDGVYFDTLTREQVKGLNAYVPGQEFTYDAQLADESTWLKPGNQAHAGTHDATEEAGRSGTYARAQQDAQQHMTGASGHQHTETAQLGEQRQSSQHLQAEQRYDYESKGQLFDTPHRLRLLEERLEVDKERFVAGSVEVGKRLETRTEHVNVELQHEDVVIERHPVTDPRPVAGDLSLEGGTETIRVDLEAERVDIEKRAYVTEEVEIGKRVETERQTFTETVGKEVLEVNRTGNVDIRADQTATGTLRESTSRMETDLERRTTEDQDMATRTTDDQLGRK